MIQQIAHLGLLDDEAIILDASALELAALDHPDVDLAPYVEVLAEYTAGILDGMRAEGANQAAIEAKAAEMQAMAESYKNPLFRTPLTFIEIFPVGLLVALVSAALLRNPKLLPARAPRAAGQV